jgi:hypothetical protein
MAVHCTVRGREGKMRTKGISKGIEEIERGGGERGEGIKISSLY